jgi:hypothetical protein
VNRSANKALTLLGNEVLQYLINHEAAHDTVKGIVAWWLPVQRIKHAVSEVEAVLQELHARHAAVKSTKEAGNWRSSSKQFLAESNTET